LYICIYIYIYRERERERERYKESHDGCVSQRGGAKFNLSGNEGKNDKHPREKAEGDTEGVGGGWGRKEREEP